MFQCRRCGSLRGERRADGPIVCDRCFEQTIRDQEDRARLAAAVPTSHVVGEQPAICAWCSAPFVAPRADVKYCCAAHRSRAWRAERRRETGLTRS